MQLRAVLEEFLETYDSGRASGVLGPVTKSRAREEESVRLSWDAFAIWLSMWMAIIRHQSKDITGRNQYAVSRMGDRIRYNRALVEFVHFSSSSSPTFSADFETLYGRLPYKCHHTLCPRYYKGFPSAKARDTHIDKQEKPNQCPEACEIGSAGFVNEKDLDKHLRNFHHFSLDEAFQLWSTGTQ